LPKRPASFGADGKIYASGNEHFDRSKLTTIVVRFNPDGTLDKSFGEEGVVHLDLADEAPLQKGRRRQQSFGIVELKNGEVLATVHALDAQGGQSIYLIRFDHNGKQLVAPQWGDSRGRVEVVFGWPNADNAKFPGGVGPADSAWNLWVDPTNSDRIYVAGHGPGPEGSGRVNLDRYVAALKTVDGSPEPSFNHGTPVSYNSLNDLTDNNRRAKVEADGSILSAGWTDFGKGFGNYATILRILPDGTFDPNFGNFIYPPETGTKLGIKPQPGVAIFNPLQADGGMTESYAAMAAGPGNWISSGPGEATAAETPSSLGFKTATANDVVAVAFDKKGLRTDWGKGGFQVVQSEGTSAKDPHEEIADAVMLPDGRSVSVGLYGAAPAAIVLKPDGSLDTSVSGDGIIELPNEKVKSGFNAAFLSPDGKRIAIASDVDEKGARLVVLSDQ
jgi:uncharacterized delta-60 repeat protein